MKVCLIDVDSKIPNFALMKISAYHKNKGDIVKFYEPLFDYEDCDILYISKVFKFTKDIELIYPLKAKVYKGGTGYDIKTKLPDEIENCGMLDYSIYPECDYSIVFTTRGCIRKCPFCIVPLKEGKIHNINQTNLNPNGKYIMILDNNFFAKNDWRDRLQVLKAYNHPLYFNSGIDLRILSEEMCEELKNCKIKQINCAWDNYKDKEIILPKLEMLSKFVKPYKILCYVLVGFENEEIVETDIERVNTIWSYGVSPFVMGYINFEDPNWKKNQSVKDFARWCNNRFIFKSSKWEEYKRRKK